MTDGEASQADHQGTSGPSPRGGVSTAGNGLPRTHVDPASVRDALRAAGLRARHGLSQNFLADVEILERIVAASSPAPGRRLLEIGPGLGVLTGALLDAGASVLAIELDHGLAERLRSEFRRALALGEADAYAPAALRLIEGDALDVAVGEIVEPPYDVVANLPYHITSPILHAMLGKWPRPGRAVLMLQREVAERIAAPPGGMSYLSVFVQYHARVRVEFIVPRAAFEPAPAVDSAVVVVEPYAPDAAASAASTSSPGHVDGFDRPAAVPRVDQADEAMLWRLVQSAFRERRKMLHNVLVRQLPLAPERVERALASASIAPDRRPQTVSVAEWVSLLRALGPIGPDERGRRASRPGRTRADA